MIGQCRLSALTADRAWAGLAVGIEIRTRPLRTGRIVRVVHTAREIEWIEF